MNTFAAFLMSLTVLALVLAGLLMIGGMKGGRDRLLRLAALLLGLSLFIPYAVATLDTEFTGISCESRGAGAAPSLDVLVPVVLGHVALAVLLLRRRLRSPERGNGELGDIERARSRERTRLPPEG